jgi:hypothetical protein
VAKVFVDQTTLMAALFIMCTNQEEDVENT